MIGWQVRRYGVTEDSEISRVIDVVVAEDAGRVTQIVIEFEYRGNNNVMTLVPCDSSNPDVFQGRVVVPGPNQPQGVIINCTRYSDQNDEWVLVGDWREGGYDYIWWFRREP